jgi:hypothetical protein
MKEGQTFKHLRKVRYHIYKISGNNLHMNDTQIKARNPIFQTVHELYDR